LFTALWGRSRGDEARQQGRSWGSLLLHRLGEASAHSSAGVIAAAAVLAWVLVGAAVGFVAWWENLLYIVSSTVTLVMLFAIQHTQARQQSATQRKLDEILRALPRADGRFIAVEEAPDHELQELADRGRDDREQALGDDPR
jgi:low affinity Fe/Cu permease